MQQQQIEVQLQRKTGTENWLWNFDSVHLSHHLYRLDKGWKTETSPNSIRLCNMLIMYVKALFLPTLFFIKKNSKNSNFKLVIWKIIEKMKLRPKITSFSVSYFFLIREKNHPWGFWSKSLIDWIQQKQSQSQCIFYLLIPLKLKFFVID